MNSNGHEVTIQNYKLKINRENINRDKLILLLFFLGFIIMNTVASLETTAKLIIMLCVFSLVKSKYFPILIIPFIMMSNAFQTIPGTSIMFYWVYFLTLFMRCILLRKIFINKVFMLPLLIYFFYELKILPMDPRRMISDLGFIIAIVIVNTEIISSRESIKSFLKYIAAFSLLAGVIPLIQGFEYAKYAQGFIRMGSLGMGDPNYSSVIYNLGIFSLIGIKEFNKLNWKLKCLKIILIIILYNFLISTLSITGITLNIIGLSLYIFLTKKFNNKIKVLTIVILMLVSVNILIPNIPDSLLVDGVIRRFQEKFLQIGQGNYNDATTARFGILEAYFNHFSNQNIIFMLFGSAKPLFHFINIWGIASHNTFIDLLYSVGILGLILMGFYLIKRVWYWYKRYREKGDITYLSILIIKIVLLLYMLSLSMFSVPLWQIALFF